MTTSFDPLDLSQEFWVRVEGVTLGRGEHESIEHGACVMELVSYVAGEEWSDQPKCASPTIGMFLRAWNDTLDMPERNALLKPLVPRLVGTRGDDATEARRAMMAGDWMVRVYAPAWLRLAELNPHAEALASLPEITYTSLPPFGLEEVTRKAASAAWDGTKIGDEVAPAKVWNAASEASRGAIDSAAVSAACAAAWAHTRSSKARADWEMVWTNTRDAARGSTFTIALQRGDAARSVLEPVRLEMQRSALILVDRMLAA